VRITEAASFYKTKDQGGTFEETREILERNKGKQVMDFDYETKLPKGWISEKDCESTGDWIFKCALYEIMKCKSKEEFNMVYLCVVSDPAKARSVTKPTAALKVVLDLVSKVCANVLGKAFKSS
jgi:hypothetical protein